MKGVFAVLLLLGCAAAQAHEHEEQESVPPPAQAGPVMLRLPGRVVPDPRLDLQVAAVQDGELTPEGSALPLPGESVKAGQVLAWLRPLLSQPEKRDLDVDLAAAQRDELLGKIQIKRYDIDEAQHLDVMLPTPSLEILTNYRSAQARGGELQRALGRRIAVVAPHDGVVLRSEAVAGRVYAAGTSLFEITAPGALAVEVRSVDSLPARAPVLSADRRPLKPLGVGYDAGLRAWRALYAVSGANLVVNQPVEVEFPQAGAEVAAQ
jgi:hypothetical protein